jgi:hypothetical protein
MVEQMPISVDIARRARSCPPRSASPARPGRRRQSGRYSKRLRTMISIRSLRSAVQPPGRDDTDADRWRRSKEGRSRQVSERRQGQRAVKRPFAVEMLAGIQSGHPQLIVKRHGHADGDEVHVWMLDHFVRVGKSVGNSEMLGRFVCGFLPELSIRVVEVETARCSQL